MSSSTRPADRQDRLTCPERTHSRTNAGYVLALTAVTAMMAGASAPSPFYPVLQERIGFSAGTMTIIFAVYAVGLLLTLLVTGSLSDHIGRRPVISAGLVILAASMLLLWQAGSVEALIGARIVQGIAAGVLLSALSAAVVDHEPPSRPGSAAVMNSVTPLAGLAVGALVAGSALDLVDEAAFGTVFVGCAVVFAALGILIWQTPESSPRAEGLLASLRPQVRVPAPAQGAFLRALPALIACWATAGLYLSLGAPLVARELGGASHLSQGLVVTALAVGGSTACFVARAWTARRTTLYGTTTLAGGMALTLLALGAASLPWFLVASVVAGTGFGTAFLGVMRSLTPLVGAHQRGELFAAVFVASYLAFGIPAVIAGFASGGAGLLATTYGYGAVVVLLAGVASLLRRFGTTV